MFRFTISSCSSGLKGMALNLEPDNVGVVVFGNDKLIKEVSSWYSEFDQLWKGANTKARFPKPS